MRHLLALVSLLFLSLPPAHAAAPPPAEAAHAMVASAHPLATEAGVEVLRAGGNAADAAVTVAFVLSVVEPFSSGLGGGGFTLYFDPEKRQAFALDGRETAPAALTEALFHPGGRYDPELSRSSGLAVGVPGLVAEMAALHKRFGTRPWATLVEPARRLAAEGFPVSPRLARRLWAHGKSLSPAARAVFMPGGRPPAVGARLIQADLARTLAAVARRGPEAFYKGSIARKIAAAVRAAKGVMTPADLAGYKVFWREPIRGRWLGGRVYSFPPPSSGGLVLVRILRALGDGADVRQAGWGSALAIHTLAELMKRAYADRNLALGDPGFVKIREELFLSPEVARRDREGVGAKATPAARIRDPRLLGAPPERVHTSHFSIVDSRGGAVAQTQTINLSFGSGLLAPGTGVLLNNEIDDFATAPGRANAFGLVQGRANAVEPGKRPLSSMTPTIVVKRGRVRAVMGSPGGATIITTTLQTLLNHDLFGMDASEAVCAPRIHHQWLPDQIRIEPFAVSAETAAHLVARGHKLKQTPAWGNAMAIFRAKAADGSLRWQGAADCRGEGTAAGF